MKTKILPLSVIIGLLFVSCEKNKNGGKLDPDAKISVTGSYSPTKVANISEPEGIAGTGITDSLEYITKYGWEYSCNQTLGRGFGFMPEEDDGNYHQLRDLEKHKLKFFGTDVISADGPGLGLLITSYTDIVVTVGRPLDNHEGPAVYPLTWYGDYNVYRDTVAYIPNAIVLEARTKITAAFAAENYAECYRLFDEAYIFVPTTGAKWRALKAAGIE